MEELIAFVAKYWVQTICVAITGVVSGLWVKTKRTYKKGKAVEKEEEIQPLKTWTEECVKGKSEELAEKFQEEKEKLQAQYATDHQALKDRFEHERAVVLDTFNSERKMILEEINDEKHGAAEDRKKILEAVENLNTGMKHLAEQGRCTQQAVLWWYKKDFLEACEELLDHDHEITFDELNEIRVEHDIYKGLGGNHEGDSNFLLVEEKYKAQTIK